MLFLVMVMVAFAGQDAEPQAQHEFVDPVSDASLFDPLPEMWGLWELSEETRLEDLDETFVLYFTDRSVLRVASKVGRVYFRGGRQLILSEELAESDIVDRFGSISCLCALEYECSASTEELQIAAGAYRLKNAPCVTEYASGIMRVELEFAEEGQAEHVKLRRLICWNPVDDAVAPLATTMPGFVKFTRKVRPGFRDPPVDDRPLSMHASSRRIQSPYRIDILADGYFGEGQYPIPEHWDAPELLGTAKPGLFTLMREIRTGRKVAIDYSEYFLDRDPYLRRLDRRHGIYYRDPYAWP